MGTYLITGAAGGIGIATVRELIRRGHRVVAVVRSEVQVRAFEALGGPEGDAGGIDVLAADLSLMYDTDRLAHETVSRYDRLDGLILNAGMAATSLRLTSEQIEETFAVNHLGAFVLAHRLLPLLERSTPARIVLTGSTDHLAVKEAIVADLAVGSGMSYTRTYARSKAVAMAAMLEMAERLASSDGRRNVLVNIADPGWTRTGLTAKAPLPIRLLVRLGKPLQNTLEDSAKVLTDLAVETVETGTCIGRKGPSPQSALLQDQDFRRDSYDDSVRLLAEKRLAETSGFLTRRS